MAASPDKPLRVPSLRELQPWTADGELRVVVESPRGSRLKFVFDEAIGAFTVGRSLPLGLCYPFDWGFVPGTKAPDGDPLDAMVMLDAPSYPGVVVTVRPVAVLKVTQSSASGRQRNDRLIVEHVDAPRSRLTAAQRAQFVQFFKAVVAFQHKRLRILGWGSAAEALRVVRSSATTATLRGG